MKISDFIARCDSFCARAGVSRVWLSKRLFSDTFRIDELARDESDVGVKRLERAVSDLSALEDSHRECPAPEQHRPEAA